MAEERIAVMVEKGNTDSIKTKVVLSESVKLPISKGDRIGRLEVYGTDGDKNNVKLGEYNLLASSDIRKASLKMLIERKLDI